jgi:hypothetical protein
MVKAYFLSVDPSKTRLNPVRNPSESISLAALPRTPHFYITRKTLSGFFYRPTRFESYISLALSLYQYSL